MRRNGYSIRDIATTLSRGVGTISDELKRNKVAGIYDPRKAHTKSQVRRRAAKFQGMTIVASKALQTFVKGELLKQQSPGAIAGRLATGIDGLPFASRDTITRFIRSVHGRRIEYELKLLKRKNKHRRKKRPAAERLQDRTSIDERPSVITNRERVGDVEADFIVSGRSGTGYLLTIVDRKIRAGFIRKILPATIVNMEQVFLDVKAAFPELKSITTDNDILFQQHPHLEALLGVPIYFCDPYSSWQKGSIKNLNKQVRKYIPKSSDISQYGDGYIQFVEHRLNSRFMSVLNYKTPAECLAAHRNNTIKEESR
jgi:IS30 family transposase